MTDDLRSLLAVDGDAADGPPDLTALWKVGRRRRARVRAARVGGAALVVAALVVGGVALAVRGDAGPVDVASGPSTTTATGGGAADPRFCQLAPRVLSRSPVETPRDFVLGSNASPPPDLVAQVRVVSASWVPLDGRGGRAGVQEHRVALQVVRPILGAAVGDRVSVVDAYGVSGPRADADLRRRIDDYETMAERIDAPIAEIDRQLVALDPQDPRYAALLAQRERVKALSADSTQQVSERLGTLQALMLAERQAARGVEAPHVGRPGPCPSMGEGNEAIVALDAPGSDGLRRISGPASVLRFERGRLDPDPNGWLADSELLRLARSSTMGELLAALRLASGR